MATKRDQLAKTMSFHSYVAIGLGSVIGIGWVMYTGQWLQDGGAAGAMIAFALCGLLLLPIGAVYAELTSAIPVAGGEMAFSYKAFGSFAAFLTAWALALPYIAVTPFETIAIGAVIESIAPAIKAEPLYFVGDYGVSLSTLIPGLLIGALLLAVNHSGSKHSTNLQFLAVAIMSACALVFISIALIKGDFANLSPLFTHSEHSWAAAPASIISVLVIAPFFMGGWDAIPQTAEESGERMAPKKLGVAIITSILLGAVFYVLIILAVGISVNSEQMAAIIDSKNTLPTAEVFRVAFGYEWAAQLVLFAALLGLTTTLNAFYIAAPRLLFSMGRGGLLPHWFAVLDPKTTVPINSLAFVGAISLTGPFIGLAALGPLVSSGAFAITTVMFFTTLSALKLRHSASQLVRPFKAHRIALVIAPIVGLILIALMIAPGSPGQLKPIEHAILFTWITFGVLAYLSRRLSGRLSKEEQDYLILGDRKKV